MNRLVLVLIVALMGGRCVFAAQAQGVLDKIKATRTVTLGYSEAAVPFSFLSSDNRPQGYTVDLCKRIAEGIQQQLGLARLDIKWVKVNVDTRIPATMKGAIDIECGSTTHTLSREEQVDFSNMIFVDGGSYLAKARNRMGTIKDLAGKKIMVISGTTTEKVLKAALEQARLGLAAGEVPVGAVLVIDGQIVARAFNQPIGACDPTAHAEVLVLREAARVVGNYRLVGADVYVTVEPCLMCVGALVHARVRHVTFGAPELKTGALVSALRALDTPEVKDGLNRLGLYAAPQNPEQFTAFIKAEMQSNEKVVRSANIRME